MGEFITTILYQLPVVVTLGDLGHGGFGDFVSSKLNFYLGHEGIEVSEFISSKTGQGSELILYRNLFLPRVSNASWMWTSLNTGACELFSIAYMLVIESIF